MLLPLVALVTAMTAADPNTPAEPCSQATQPAPEPEVNRVGGDLLIQAERRGGVYACGTALITTPLPQGYPPPTPPGAIEIKHYPPVRRAQVERDGDSWWGMNGAFWPLFRHISRREIAMTSPVEMNYQGLVTDKKGNPDSWTMSFLYRTPDLGPVGPDRSVEVVDVPALTVVSVGYQGSYSVENVRTHLKTIEVWLDAQAGWLRDGEPRALFYNGPEKREREQWAEVQLPIKPAPGPAPSAPATESTSTPPSP